MNQSQITLPYCGHIQVEKGTKIMGTDPINPSYWAPQVVVETKAKIVANARIDWQTIEWMAREDNKENYKDVLALCHPHSTVITNGYGHSQHRQERVALATWGDGRNTKWALLKDIKLVDAPVRKAPAPRKDTGPTLRQRMLPKSRWELTQPAALVKATSHRDLEPDGELAIGTVVEIVSFQTYGPGYTIGSWAEVVANGVKRLVEFKELNKDPIQRSDTQISPAYVIRDKVSGKFYQEVAADPEYACEGFSSETREIRDRENAELSEAQRKHYEVVMATNPNASHQDYRLPKEQYDPILEKYQPEKDAVRAKYKEEMDEMARDPMIMTDKFSKARKWKRPQDVKGNVLEMSGYYEGMEVHGDYDGVRSGYGRKIAIPTTWEFATYDKLTKSVHSTEDMQTWLADTWRLRDLTVKYGSGVRALYKKIEKAGQLDDFQAMIIFTKKQLGDRSQRWGDDDLDEASKTEIKEALETFDKKDIKRGSAKEEYAVAVKDLDSAVMLRLSYSGNLTIHLIDLKTLTEVVEK